MFLITWKIPCSVRKTWIWGLNFFSSCIALSKLPLQQKITFIWEKWVSCLLANTTMTRKYKSSLSSHLFSSRDFVSYCYRSRFTFYCTFTIALCQGLLGTFLWTWVVWFQQKLMILQPVMEILRHLAASQQCLHISQTCKQDFCISKIDTQAFKSDDF